MIMKSAIIQGQRVFSQEEKDQQDLELAQLNSIWQARLDRLDNNFSTGNIFDSRHLLGGNNSYDSDSSEDDSDIGF
jgi:hypothetical protein